MNWFANLMAVAAATTVYIVMDSTGASILLTFVGGLVAGALVCVVVVDSTITQWRARDTEETEETEITKFVIKAGEFGIDLSKPLSDDAIDAMRIENQILRRVAKVLFEKQMEEIRNRGEKENEDN